MSCDDFLVRITGDWPLGTIDRDEKFSLILRLVEEAGSYSTRDPRDLGYPDLLSCAAAPLGSALRDAIADGFCLRADVAHGEESLEPWPRWCLSGSQVNGLLESLKPRSNSDMLVDSRYPVLLWLIPRVRLELAQKIERFRVQSSDSTLFNTILAGGVVRFSFSDAFGDVLAEPHLGALILKWLSSAQREGTGARVRWNLRPGSAYDTT